jgi:hypothetical protein
MTAGDRAKKPKEEGGWQPANVILGLLIVGCVLYFVLPASGVLAAVRAVPAVILIFTKKNSLFRAVVLFVFGLTAVLLPSPDAFLLMIAAAYMFVSWLLSVFKVGHSVAIGLAVAAAVGLFMFNVLVLDKAFNYAPEGSLAIVMGIDGGSGVVTSSTPSADDASTTFGRTQPIYVIGQGMQRDVGYACRILNITGGVAIPLDEWRISKSGVEGGTMHVGTVNDMGSLPLRSGSYTVQLVKLERNTGVIVAESGFSVAPYDERLLSEFVAYISEDSEPDVKYYDNYTVKAESFNIGVWAQSPNGTAVAGTVRFYKTNWDGVVESTTWDGEHEFVTESDGEPTRVNSFGGHIPPGIYHYELAADGRVLADLKLIV